MNKDDGGPAFPNAPFYGLEENCGVYELLVDEQSSGMSLRDYFAAKAIIAYHADGEYSSFEDVANWCYRMADAMLKAREE